MVYLSRQMADGVTAVTPTTGGTNGAGQAHRGDPLPGPSNAERAAQRIRAGRAQTMAAFDEMPDPSGARSKSTRDAASPDEQPFGGKRPGAIERPSLDREEKPAEDETDDVEVKPDAVEAKPAGKTTDVETTEAKKPEADPEVDRRSAVIQRREEASRAKISKERAELDAVRKEWAPQLKEAQDFKALKASAKKGSAGLLAAVRALGLGDDDLETAAQVLYANSKAGAADPTRKAHAERMMAEVGQSTDISSLRDELRDLKQELAQERQKATHERAATNYLDVAVKMVGDDHPIAQRLAAKNPTKLRSALLATAQELADENEGDTPDIEDVLARYEKTRRAELLELGVDVPTKTPKQNDKPAEKKPPAKTLGNDLSTTRVPRPRSSDKEHRAETLSMLESGKLE